MDLLVVGSGFFGLTFAREAAERFGMNVTVITLCGRDLRALARLRK